jgi:hypothetical protein
MLELKGDVVVPRVLAGPKICGHYLTSIVQASAKPGPKAHVVSHVNELHFCQNGSRTDDNRSYY